MQGMKLKHLLVWLACFALATIARAAPPGGDTQPASRRAAAHSPQHAVELAELARKQGRWKAALEHLDRAANPGDEAWTAKLLLARAQVLSQAGGRDAESVSALAQAQAIAQRTGNLALLVEYHAAAADIHSRARRFDAAVRDAMEQMRFRRQLAESELAQPGRSLDATFSLSHKERENKRLKALENQSKAEQRVIHLAMLLGVMVLVGGAALWRFRLRQSARRIAHANLRRSASVADAGRGLREPAHALGLYMSALARHELEPNARDLLKRAARCAGTMCEMFRSLLDIARLDAAVMSASRQSFAMQPMLDRAVEQFEAQARAKGLGLRVRPTGAWVRSDPRLLQRILDNLVSNAVRYTGSGQILIACRRLPAGRIRLAVYDSGPGVDESQHEAIFEEFHRLDTNFGHGHSNGMGLGLSIVRRLAALIDAPLSIRSRPGHGSMFGIDLELAQAEPPAENPAKGTQGPGPALPCVPRPSEAGSTVLVIDDDANTRGATAEILSVWGHDTFTFGSTELEALSESGIDTADIVICEYRLQGHGSGIDLIRELRRSIRRDLPALLVTAETAPEHITAILASGIPALHKPVSTGELQVAIDSALSQAKTLAPA